MTPQEIQEGNMLIAYFMGATYNPELNAPWKFAVQPNKYLRPDARIKELMYHYDWNWLMPVVEKMFTGTTEMQREFNGCALFEYGIAAPIDDIWNGVVEFVQWYNNELPSPK